MITALMAVYHGTDAKQLKQSIDSLKEQTLPLEEIIVVADGPISEEVKTVLGSYPDLTLLPQPENKGAGVAVQIGLEQVRTPFVLRIDDDDIAHPRRAEVQAEYLRTHPSISVVGTAVEEFGSNDGNVRALPVSPDQVAKYAKINSPLNQPSVMARTADLLAVGGYRDVHLMEDYDLWARLIAGGYKLVNLPEPLTYFRVSDAQFARRTGRDMVAAEIQMQKNLVAYGLVSPTRAVINFFVRSTYRLLPKALLKRVYSHLFHR